MNTKHFGAWVTLLTAGALVVSVANAQDNAAGGGGRRNRGADNAAPGGPGAPTGGNFGGRGNFGGGGGGITLDDKQRELIRDARQKNNDKFRELDEKLRTAQREFVRATVAEKYDEKVVREKADAVAKLQAEIAVLNAQAFSSISPTLKPEQREQLETSNFGYMIVSGGGGRGGFGGGPGGATGPGGTGFGGRGGNAPNDPNAAQGGRRRGGGPGQ